MVERLRLAGMAGRIEEGAGRGGERDDVLGGKKEVSIVVWVDPKDFN